MTLFLRLGVLALCATCAAESPRTQAVAAPEAGQTGAKQPESGKDATSQANVKAVRANVILETALTSRNASQGKEFKTVLEKSVTLPNEISLPKGTVLHGTVLQSSVHSKAKPNGALMLFLDEARPKNAPPVKLFVKIRDLAPSLASEEQRENLPGTRLGGTSNSGGSQELAYQATDHTEIRYNIKDSGLKGVFLQASSNGSGVVYSVDEDVYLDDGVIISLLMAPVPANP